MRATRGTALLAGAWCALGMIILDSWEEIRPHYLLTNRVLDAIGALAFFFVPVIIFVIAPTNSPSFRGRLTDEFWKNYPETALRRRPRPQPDTC